MAKGSFTGAIAIALAVTIFGSAHGKTLRRTAVSGKPTVMYEYGNWKSDCSSHGGIVKVLTKPQHGKLTPVRENVTIRASRFPRDMSCYGKQIPGFVVYYTPQPGFVGFDTFAIEVTYPGHPPDIDTFSVDVK
jgi:hypothetical protein